MEQENQLKLNFAHLILCGVAVLQCKEHLVGVVIPQEEQVHRVGSRSMWSAEKGQLFFLTGACTSDSMFSL